ncbi:MAG TPA: hypothetical protein VLX92_21130 [Kofleriaceae bacterium]|nr:hypothetical protein [Kofleriaceae bacterium]
MRLAVLALVAACSGNVGTISVSLVTAPGSTVLDNAETLQLTITNPHTVSTSPRGASGFEIDVDLPANGDAGQLIVDAFDASGNRVATGMSPPFAVGAIDASVAIYMAAPNTIGASPATLSVPLSALAAGPLSYGAIFAGGRDATGAPSNQTSIYNAFDHSVLLGVALPAPLSGVTAAVGGSGIVYLFGGADATGTATADLLRFDTTIAPNGAFTDDGVQSGLARAGQLAIPLGNDDYIVTGMPVADLAGITGDATARSDITSLPAAGASVLASDGSTIALFASSAGVSRLRADTFDSLAIAGAARDNAVLVALPGGQIAVACGSTDLVIIDPLAGTSQTIPDTPATARGGCAAAATSRHLLIAGGDDFDPMAYVLDASTFAPVATVPMVVPRKDAVAIALPDDQILIAGGVDATGAPTQTIELFTPDSPE